MTPDAFADVLVLCVKQAVTPLLVKMAHLERELEGYASHVAMGMLSERVAVLEARPPVPGPPGPEGPPGMDGANGIDGKPGLEYCGVYVNGKLYDRGHVVTWDGSLWHCNEPETLAKPGVGGAAWTLIVKRGRDGRDRTT